MKKKDLIISPDFIGKQIGKLTVIDLLGAANGETVLFCQCQCGQALLLYEEEIETRRKACENCAYRGNRNFNPNEIARFTTQFSYIPFDEEVIINSQLTTENNPQFVVEYKGKLILCRASDLEATGKKF